MSKYNLGDMGQKLIELTGDLIAVSTKEGYFLALSKEWEQTLEYSVEEIRQKTFMNFVHPEDHQLTSDCLGSLLLGLEVKNFRNRYVTKSGKTVWLDWCAAKDKQTELIYAKARPLEPDTKLEAFFLEQNKTFQANKLSILGELAAGVAHELNNPLAIIAGYLQILELENISNSVEIGEEQLKMMKAMLKATERATKIIDNLKAISMDSSKELMAPHNFQEIVECPVNLLRNRFDKHSIKYEFDLKDCNIFVNCKRAELSQIFFNLILNAFESAKNDSKPWIKISSSLENDEIKIVISNSGATIPMELRSKIFSPFFTTKTNSFGSGMGLAIANSVLQFHGGSISLDTKVPYNSFVIKLPVSKDSN